jgi:hypothetical protein
MILALKMPFGMFCVYDDLFAFDHSFDPLWLVVVLLPRLRMSPKSPGSVDCPLHGIIAMPILSSGDLLAKGDTR